MALSLERIGSCFRVVEMRQLSKNEQTEINFDERISSTPRYAQRISKILSVELALKG